ncbi:YncE family protein [Nocardia sp.]|uniref:YncE family protein n=1 Tax=Nocardia sp. TaxID=1821 RepID=UPI00261C34B6|nr:YncE family protein [Nocardia sp.]
MSVQGGIVESAQLRFARDLRDLYNRAGQGAQRLSEATGVSKSTIEGWLPNAQTMEVKTLPREEAQFLLVIDTMLKAAGYSGRERVTVRARLQRGRKEAREEREKEIAAARLLERRAAETAGARDPTPHTDPVDSPGSDDDASPAGVSLDAREPEAWRWWVSRVIVPIAAAMSLSIGAATCVHIVINRPHAPSETTGTDNLTIPVGRDPRGLAIDPALHRLYVTARVDGAMSVIDTDTHKVIKKGIPVGPNPISVTVDPATHLLYVANDASTDTPAQISVIDGDNLTDVIAVAAHHIAVDPNKPGIIYTANKADNTVSVIEVGGGKHRVLHDIQVGAGPDFVLADPTNPQILYAANQDAHTVSVIDLTALTETATIQVGKEPRSLAFEEPHTLYSGNWDHTVTIIDTSTRATASILAGASPSSMVIDPDTHILYTANWGSMNISVVDTRKRRLIEPAFPTGGSPTNIAIDLGTHTLYTANWDTNSVTIIDTSK